MIFVRVKRYRNPRFIPFMKLSNNENAKKRCYNHVLNHLKNIKAEILNTTVLELTRCDSKTFKSIEAVVSELKSLNMTIKNQFTLVSCFVCMDAIQMVQKSSMKTKNSHNLAAGRLTCL